MECFVKPLFEINFSQIFNIVFHQVVTLLELNFKVQRSQGIVLFYKARVYIALTQELFA